jgi:hypothetical protein
VNPSSYRSGIGPQNSRCFRCGVIFGLHGDVGYSWNTKQTMDRTYRFPLSRATTMCESAVGQAVAAIGVVARSPHRRSGEEPVTPRCFRSVDIYPVCGSPCSGSDCAAA